MVDGAGYSWTNVVGTTTGNMPNPDGGYYTQGRTGNGYARISANFQSDNNYLKNLITDLGIWDKTYSYNVEDYTITVESNVEVITVSADKGDDNQEIEGLGPHPLDVGNNEIPVVVTAENGETRIYYLNVIDIFTHFALNKELFENKGIIILRNRDKIHRPFKKI